MTKSEGDLATETRLERLQFLVEGLPTLRYILSQVRDYLLTQDPKEPPRKLIVAEGTPIVAWAWEMALNYLYVETRVLHSGLNNEERGRLVKDFNNPKNSIRVLILMYNVGSQGTNLDPCYNRVIVATGATNAALEIQAWGRAIRVSQEHEVSIIRCKVINSHDQTRDSRQMDKAVMDMATRSWSPSIRQLLVELLNEANSEVKKAHNSVAGQAINIKIAKSGGPQNSDNPMDIGFEGEIQLAKPVQDSYDIEQGDVIMEDGSGERAQRKRIKPRRLVDNPTFYKYNFEVAANATSSDYDETDDDASVFSDDSYSSTSGEMLLQKVSRRTLKEFYSKMERKDQEEFDQDEISLCLPLSLSPGRVYTLEDLEDHEVHDRALGLLYRARSGQSKDYSRISPHIKYKLLHSKVVAGSKKKLVLQDNEYTYLLQTAKDGKASKGVTRKKSKKAKSTEKKRGPKGSKGKTSQRVKRRKTEVAASYSGAINAALQKGLDAIDRELGEEEDPSGI